MTLGDHHDPKVQGQVDPDEPQHASGIKVTGDTHAPDISETHAEWKRRRLRWFREQIPDILNG